MSLVCREASVFGQSLSQGLAGGGQDRGESCQSFPGWLLKTEILKCSLEGLYAAKRPLLFLSLH